MRMTSDELKALLQRKSVSARNPELCGIPNQNTSPRKTPVVESDTRNGPLEKEAVQAKSGQSFLIRVVAVRKRLLDEDNCCEKFLVDACRMSGLIPDDCAAITKIETSQRKCNKGEPEYVDMTIERI